MVIEQSITHCTFCFCFHWCLYLCLVWTIQTIQSLIPCVTGAWST